MGGFAADQCPEGRRVTAVGQPAPRCTAAVHPHSSPPGILT
jgi:hypothetical protein